MVHSANLSHEEQYLQVVNKESASPSNNSLIYDGGTPVVENILFSKVSPLFYKTRVHLSLVLSDEFKKNFGLIRGLIEFHRLKHFSFEYHFGQATIETDIETSHLGELQSFLTAVSIWLKREIHFKNSLKVILEFENRYKLAKTEVYALIHTAVH